MNDVEFKEDGEPCGHHYRVQIQVDSCSGLHVAFGYNMNLDMTSDAFIEGAEAGMRTAMPPGPATDATIAQLKAMLSSRRPPSKTKKTKGQKVVPIRPIDRGQRGPFAKPKKDK